VNTIDTHLAQFFSSLTRLHPSLDSLALFLTSSYFLKGQVVMLMFWWTWFSPGPQKSSQRRILLLTLLACLLALALGRVMVSSLPSRERPIDNPIFRFNLPFSADQTPDSSSFPSDHAILFVALAMGIFLASRRVGTLAFAWVAVIVCLPRLWLGFHYLSDILAGGLIGSGFVLAFNWQKLQRRIADPILALCEGRPQLLYVALLVFSYQVAELFNPMRRLLVLLHHPGASAIVSVLPGR
jgi:membrane-associated phospholipid phosphatase